MIPATDLVGARTNYRSRGRRFGSIVRDNFRTDLRAQLHQLFLEELFLQTRIQIVRDIRGRISHRVSQLDDKAFRVIEWGPIIAEHSEQFVIAQACFSAHGRINIYSKRTSDPRRASDLSQLNVTQRHKSPTCQAPLP